MQLIEVGTIMVKRNGKTNSEIYSTVKNKIEKTLSKITFKKVEDVVRCCFTSIQIDLGPETATTISGTEETMVSILILLIKPFYDEHFGKLVNDVKEKELKNFINNIPYVKSYYIPYVECYYTKPIWNQTK